MMDRLDAMALFVSAVDVGSLAAAGRRHGRSAAAATRAIALLEREAGETLLLRSTRRLSLTPAGERHVAVWRDLLERLRALHAPGDRTTMSGTVTLTAPELFGRMHVLPPVEAILREHRGLSVRLLLANRVVNVVGEGVDVAVRLAPLPDSSLTGVRVGEVRALLCASPDYLASTGTPTRLADLEHHACIGLDPLADGEPWSFAPPGRRGRSVRVRPRLAVDQAAAAIDAALRGTGIVQARSYQVADHLAAGRLVRLLPDWEGAAIPAHVLFPPERGRGAAVRALVDRLVPTLRARLAEIASGLR